MSVRCTPRHAAPERTREGDGFFTAIFLFLFNLSKIERQSDMQIATLRKVVHALGGQIEIIARFPNANVRIVLPNAA